MKKEFFKQNNYVQDHEKSRVDEFIQLINKESLIKETLYLNNDNLKENYCRIILMKIIYFINQGQKIDVLDIELLYFRITKLLKFESPLLRRLSYKILKKIINKNFEIMLISCLKKDISSSNINIRLNAIKMVPYLSEQSNIIEFQKQLQMTINDKCESVSSVALLSGLHICLKFPNIVSLWTQDIKQSLQNNNFHALILFYQIQKKEKNLFLKALIQMIKQKLSPLSIISVLRFIKESLFNHKQIPDMKYYEEELIEYLFLQLSSDDILIFFEAVKVMISMIKSLPDRELRQIINILSNYLKPEDFIISQYTTIITLKKVSRLTNLNKFVNKKIYQQLEILAYSPHTGISANSLFVCMKIKNQYNSIYLRKIYTKTDNLGEQHNFLHGLLEFLDIFHIVGSKILGFLEMIITQDSDDKVIKLAFKIIKYILRDVNQQLYLKSIHSFFQIAAICDIKYKFKVLRLVLKEFSVKLDYEINKPNIDYQFEFLRDYFSKIQNQKLIVNCDNDHKYLISQSIISEQLQKLNTNKKMINLDEEKGQ